MLTAILLTVASILPRDAALRETADIVEINQVYDGEGRQVLEQLIAWNWENDRHVVSGWRLMADKTISRPFVYWTENGRLCVLRGHSWRETAEQFDVELAERERLPACKRRGLMGTK
jgi:hypothetical protein